MFQNYFKLLAWIITQDPRRIFPWSCSVDRSGQSPTFMIFLSSWRRLVHSQNGYYLLTIRMRLFLMCRPMQLSSHSPFLLIYRIRSSRTLAAVELQEWNKQRYSKDIRMTLKKTLYQSSHETRNSKFSWFPYVTTPSLRLRNLRGCLCWS